MSNLRMTEEEVAEHNLRVKNRVRVAPTPEKTERQKRAMIGRTARGTMNKLEARFAAEVLDMRRMAGEIRGYRYEEMKFRIGNGAWYCPDFMVLNADNSIQFVETKGFCRDAGLVRIKAAADRYPMFKFIMVRFVEGEWTYREF